jgi:hypothetical protein
MASGDWGSSAFGKLSRGLSAGVQNTLLSVNVLLNGTSSSVQRSHLLSRQPLATTSHHTALPCPHSIRKHRASDQPSASLLLNSECGPGTDSVVRQKAGELLHRTAQHVLPENALKPRRPKGHKRGRSVVQQQEAECDLQVRRVKGERREHESRRKRCCAI